ncbi:MULTISPECIES: hypothetical protein [Chryseobacterium]|uniref:Bacteriocin n=1 Tax=Chryseobacterium gallinarum TaxID=1324352 RepID=A0ABX6KVX9_CHRGL|nr:MULTISPECIES: hypothetical protein [Chryseobacterium]MCL8535466.1 hypothetical protein [Chryseobacterium gallinarum]QIY92418.1 hypothetical protein FOB44_17950 [Chryseobacterium gallinarum]
MKNLKKLNRNKLKSLGGGIGTCYEYCPAGPYGPGQPRSCEDYYLLPQCCKLMVLVDIACSAEREM